MKDDIGYKIIERLDLLVKLSVLNSIKDKDFQEQVMILSEIGIQPKDIAEILGKTPNNVRVTLSRSRAEKKRTKNQQKD